jgi:hypothetical protein
MVCKKYPDAIPGVAGLSFYYIINICGYAQTLTHSHVLTGRRSDANSKISV